MPVRDSPLTPCRSMHVACVWQRLIFKHIDEVRLFPCPHFWNFKGAEPGVIQAQDHLRTLWARRGNSRRQNFYSYHLADRWSGCMWDPKHIVT